MNITFTSHIEQNGEKNKIEFTSEVTVSKTDNFKIYEFKDPSSGVFNRIEVSNSKANIFAGASTINLELNKDVDNRFETPVGIQILKSHMTKLESESGREEFTYTLELNNQTLGSYNIILKVQ